MRTRRAPLTRILKNPKRTARPHTQGVWGLLSFPHAEDIQEESCWTCGSSHVSPFSHRLFFTSVLFDAAGAWFNRDNFRDGALWLFILRLHGGVAAAIMGDWAEVAAEKAGIAESMIETHETLAFVTLGIFGVLLLGRLVWRNRFMWKTIVPYFLNAAIGLGTLSATGHYGGDLVHEQGAGVALAHKAGLNVPEYTQPYRL